MSNVVYSNAPSFRRKCDHCGREYRPHSSKHRSCGKCGSSGIRDERIPMMTAWDDSLGVPALPPTEEQVEKSRAMVRIKEVSESADCGCEPCPFDLRTTGFQCESEDPIFRGSRCLWHLQIRGRQRTVSVGGVKQKVFAYIYFDAIEDGVPMLCCDIGDIGSMVDQHGWTSKRFPADEINEYAKIIGARKPKS